MDGLTDGWIKSQMYRQARKNQMLVYICTAPDENYCNLLNAFNRWIKENKGMLSTSNTH